MRRVAWFTCALLALAHGRIYERCELARDLLALGVEPDDIATWVCIAYHESRFDTSANNPYSGDHGIFQISELYWCGPGKACDLSCAMLRDEDISNDLQCALQIHEEHTRLQGNGFLAWVVYPQHCKHNTKKYLVDCDISVKNSVPITKSRVFMYENRYFPNYNYQQYNVEELLPPYLSIGNIIRANYGKVLELDKNKVDWYNYKLNNIDDLKLLTSFIKQPQEVTATPTTSSTTESTEYIPPVVPWRTIETNQFRHKNIPNTEITSPPTSEKEYSSVTLSSTTSPSPASSTRISTSTIASTTSKGSTSVILDTQPTTQVTTAATQASRSTLISRFMYKYRPRETTTPITSTTSKELLSSNSKTSTTISGREWSTVPTTKTTSSLLRNISTTTVRTPYTRWNTPRETTVRTTTETPFITKLITIPSTTDRSTPAWSTTAQSTTARWTTARSTTARSTTARSTTARSTTARSTTAPWTTARPTTARPTTTRPTTARTTATRPTTARPTTARPTTARTTTARPTDARPPTTAPSTTTRSSTAQSHTTHWNTGQWTTSRSTIQSAITHSTSTSRATTTPSDIAHITTTSSTNIAPPNLNRVIPIDRIPSKTTLHDNPIVTTTTSKPSTNISRYSVTFRTATTTTVRSVMNKANLTNQITTSRPLTYSTSTPKLQTTTRRTRPTQSIFDLYLNPTKPPKLDIPRFFMVGSKRFGVQIFANGTTTPAPIHIKHTLKGSKGIKLDDKLDMP